jgi:hypothetical protein
MMSDTLAPRQELTRIVGLHRYVLRWDLGDEDAAIDAMADWAKCPDHPFSLCDAAMLCGDIAVIIVKQLKGYEP